MKVIIAMDSMKGSLTSLQAGAAVKAGIRRVLPNAEICVRPLADGGEGTVTALTEGIGGRIQTATATGPLGRPVNCAYGILPDNTAVIEIASAAGLTLVPDEERNPLNTTTYGVGELIKDAVQKGCRSFMIGLGGSATNDGGIGMLQALGFGMLDADGNEVPRGAKGLQSLTQITEGRVLPELKECTFRIACDVNNPLCGKQGASAVYGPQKGATPSCVAQMDKWLNNYSKLAQAKYPRANPEQAGAGAAGGLGFAFLTFLNATLQSGVEIVLQASGLENEIKNADIVVTGEGRLDGQSATGKAPVGVAKLAKKYHKPVLSLCGCIGEDARACNKYMDAYFPILQNAVPPQEAMRCEVATKHLIATAEQVFRLIARLQNQN